MRNCRFNYGNRCYILTGDCITVYDNTGTKISHKFFADCKSALVEYLSLVTSLSA